MDNFVSFDGLGSTFLHNIYGSSKGRIRTDLIGEDLDFILELMKDRGIRRCAAYTAEYEFLLRQRL